MGVLDWWRKLRREGTEDNISQMQLDIRKYGTKNAMDTAEREASVLKSLKDGVYKQDEKKIKSLIQLFNQLDTQQLEMAGRVDQIKQGVSMMGVARGRGKAVGGLIKRLKTVAKNFDGIVKQNRANIENINASIKSNDFQFAEMLINKAIESAQDLKKKAMEAEQLEKQINRNLMDTATTTP